MRVVTVFWIYNITILYTGCRCQNLNNPYFEKQKKTGKICRRDSKHFLLSNMKGNIFILEKIYRPMKNLKKIKL
jgi:hypothetical protein